MAAIVRADLSAETISLQARRTCGLRTIKGREHVCDAGFCPDGSFRRRQYAGATAAVRPHLRHHVFFDPAAAAKAAERAHGAGQKLAARRHGDYVGWTAGKGN